MRSQEEVNLVAALHRQGLAMSEIARRTGIPYRTVTHWLADHAPDQTRNGTFALCADDIWSLPREAYVYLFGLYLGDGCIYTMPKGVHRLAVFCANEYPVLIQACAQAMAAVMPNKIGYRLKDASTDIRGIFGRACDALGIERRQNNARNLSVAKRASVALLDEFVGPKT